MDDSRLEIAKLRAALVEVMSNRGVFSTDTYTQIILSLYDRIRQLQTQPVDFANTDEIRLVTVMFIDLVDSTRIARRLKAENWKKILGDVHNLLSEVIHKWGGEIGQFLGDGMLCFFGSQRSQEDDVLRAVNCAMEVQDTIKHFTDQRIGQGRQAHHYTDTEADTRILLTTRIGMSTGQVVVGMVGVADKMELLAMGTPTNLAARLQALCEPGRVVVDANTYQRVRDHFAAESNGVTSLKGFEQPVEYFTIQHRRQQSTSQLVVRHIATIPTPFVGRDAELNRLLEICHATIEQGILHFVTVYGDIGIGKSRLLQETLDHVQTLPIRHFVIATGHDRHANAYSLLHDMLAVGCDLKEDTPPSVIELRIRQFIAQTLEDEEAESVAQLVGFLAGYSFTDSPPAQSLKSVGAEQKRMILSRVGRWFHSLAAHNPLLIVVDNLHWLDQESLGLLEYLALELAGEPVFFLTSARTEFKVQYSDYMRPFDRYIELTLNRLSEGQITALLRAVLQNIDYAPDELSHLIRDRSEGNPFFIEEFLRMLFDNGVFEATEVGRWKTNRMVYEQLEAQLPNGLLALLQARLDELRASSRRVIQVASVIGHVFWESALVEVSGFPMVRAELTDLEKRGMIVEHEESVFDGEREYAFRNSLYREVAYAMMTGDNRRAYHYDAASWFSQHVMLNMDYLEVLAEQYLASDQYEQALTAYWASAADLYERGILPRTLRVIESGWDVARDVPREIALPIVSRLWMLRGQVLDSLDEYAEASAASETALMLMKEMPVGVMLDEQVTASLSLGNSYIHMGRYDEALEVLNETHTMLPKENPRYQAAVLRAFGALYRARGQFDKSFSYQQQALVLAEESGNLRETARVLALLGSTALNRGDVAGALGYYERALDMNRRDNNVYYQSLDLRHLAEIHRILFAFDRALELCDQAEKLQTSIGHHDPFVAVNRGLCLIHLGDITPGMKLLFQAARENHQNVTGSLRAQVALLQGLVLSRKDETCLELAQSRLAEMREHSRLLYGRALLWLGLAQAGVGSPGEAYQTLEQAVLVESESGGCDLWQAHLALSELEVNPNQDADRRRAWALLQQRIDSLHSRPDLQTTLRGSAPVRTLEALL